MHLCSNTCGKRVKVIGHTSRLLCQSKSLLNEEEKYPDCKRTQSVWGGTNYLNKGKRGIPFMYTTGQGYGVQKQGENNDLLLPPSASETLTPIFTSYFFFNCCWRFFFIYVTQCIVCSLLLHEIRSCATLHKIWPKSSSSPEGNKPRKFALSFLQSGKLTCCYVACYIVMLLWPSNDKLQCTEQQLKRLWTFVQHWL